MKKRLLVVISLLAVLLLCSCGGTAEEKAIKKYITGHSFTFTEIEFDEDDTYEIDKSNIKFNKDYTYNLKVTLDDTYKFEGTWDNFGIEEDEIFCSLVDEDGYNLGVFYYSIEDDFWGLYMPDSQGEIWLWA